MSSRLDCLNGARKHHCLGERNDPLCAEWYIPLMAAPTHDWYLRDWLRTLGKRQSDVVRDLDWNKARVSLMVRGEQQYTRDALNQLADYLNVRPFELLMHPSDAMALRRLRAEMMRLASEMPATEEKRVSAS